MPNDDLGQQEKSVLDLIATNPFASQQEIATALGLARSTVAAHITQLIQKGYLVGRGYVLPVPERIVCFGGATVDHSYRAPAPLVLATSNPVEGSRGFGGVARNVAENLARLGKNTVLVSIIGDDANGRAVLAHLRNLGIDTTQIIINGEHPTAEYAAVIGPDGDLFLGIAEMDIFSRLTPGHLDRVWPQLASASWVFADCNLSAEVLAALCTRKADGRFRLAVDGVSTIKVMRLPQDLSSIDVLFMNKDEACAYLTTDVTAEGAATLLLERGARQVVITEGAKGAIVGGPGHTERVLAVPARFVDATGAGDAMIAGTLSDLLADVPLREAVGTGALVSALTTEHRSSVHPDLSQRFLAAAREQRGIRKAKTS